MCVCVCVCVCVCFVYLLRPSLFQPTAKYVWHIIMLIEAYSVILLVNYLVVFVLLVIIYWLVLKHIRTIRDGYGALTTKVIL